MGIDLAGYLAFLTLKKCPNLNLQYTSRLRVIFICKILFVSLLFKKTAF